MKAITLAGSYINFDKDFIKEYVELLSSFVDSIAIICVEELENS